MKCVIVGSRLPEIAFQTLTGSFTTDTSYTFSSTPIGPAHSSRVVIVAVAYINSTPTSATVTVGGTSATEISGCAKRMTSGASTEFQIKCFRVNIASGTTANVVVTTSALGCWIGVWSAYYLRSGTPVDSVAHEPSSGAVVLDLNTSARGVGCGFGVTAANVTWTGADEDHDAITAGVWMTGAHFTQGSAAGSPRTVRISSGAIGCAVSFR